MIGLSMIGQYQAKERGGKLCYFTSGKSWDLPLRDVRNEYNSGFKKEPSYETASYNRFSSCNQRSVVAALNRGLSHLLFVTKYHGQIGEYRGKYLITGAFEIGRVGRVDGRLYVEAKMMVFTDVQSAYEVTPERWRIICPPASKPPANLRWMTQVIGEGLFEEIYEQLCLHNKVEDYIRLVEQIKNSV